jgi:hypothetical protein
MYMVVRSVEMAGVKLRLCCLRSLQNFEEIFFLPKFRYKLWHSSGDFTRLNPRGTFLNLNPVYCLLDLTSA